MHQSTYKSIVNCFHMLAVDYTNYETLLQCYIYAVLAIKEDEGIFSKNTGAYNFENMCHRYGLTERPKFIYDKFAFPCLCTDLADENLHNDYRDFFDTFAPYIVAKWDDFEAEFSDRSMEVPIVLYHILKTTRESGLPLKSVSEEQLCELYSSSRRLQGHLSMDAFIRCWKAIYCFPIPKLNVPTSKNLVEIARLYRKHKVPGISLLKNYCLLNRYAKELEDAFNPWEEFQRSIKGNNAITGVSLEETVFNAVARILKEKPSNVVRATLYPYPELFGKKGGEGIAAHNDGRFECSFLMGEFEKLAASAKRILIVNPGPDFLVAWNRKLSQYACQCTVAASSVYVASAYRSEFKKLKFCLLSDIAEQADRYDFVAIISTNTAEEIDLKPIIRSCKEDGQVLALVPQTMLSQANDSIGSVLASHSCHVRRIISIATDATVSKPRKKMLLLAQRSATASVVIPTFFTHCNPDGHNLVFEKGYIYLWSKQLISDLTLDKMRRKVIAEEKKYRSVERRNNAHIYSFSEEIKLRYTIHTDKHGSLVGEAYYRGQKKGEKWNSNVTQKGLRSKDRQAIINRIEQVAYYETVSPCIVNDILDHYQNNIEQCSLKTIWFCCRDKLLRQRTYDDALAQTVLFRVESPLSNIRPAFAKEDDYRSAMQGAIPEDSNAIVKYWKQLNIIMGTAASEGFVRFNPIPALLPEVSKKASKQLQNIRNMLSKKTLTLEEEARILAFLNEETAMDFGPRKAKRFEAESIWLLGAIHLFTGMSTREACALTWDNFVKIPNLDAYQLEVYKFLQDDGSITYQLDEKTSKYSYRKVPLAPLLANMLLSRKAFMHAVLGYSEKQIQTMPIIMASEYQDPRKLPNKLFCKFSKATSICRQLIQKADIPIQELILPGSDKDIILDMNKYQGDIFYSNFKHRANHTCAFQRGELSYTLGNKAPDTFSQHYCDYSSDLAQYSMVQKLQRWTYLHESPSISGTAETSCLIRKNQIVTDFAKTRHNAVDITLMAEENVAGSYVEVEVECDHGVTGTVAVYPYPENGGGNHE